MKDHRKNILNFSERKTAKLLREIANEHECIVHEKVRVADALNIRNSSLTKKDIDYAMRAHFDFVVSQKSDTKALFAVEFDGPLHQSDFNTQRRDAIKDSICEKLGMPLLRVDSEFINAKVGRFQLLSYFIDIWFLSETFYKLQNEGCIAQDEIFDPYSILTFEDSRVKRMFDPSEEAKEFLYKLNLGNKIKPYPPIMLNGQDNSRRYSICLTIILVREGSLFSTGCFKELNLWPVLSSDVAEDIAIIGLAEKVVEYFNGNLKPYGFKEIESEFNRWKYNVDWKIYQDKNGFPCFLYKHRPPNL